MVVRAASSAWVSPVSDSAGVVCERCVVVGYSREQMTFYDVGSAMEHVVYVHGNRAVTMLTKLFNLFPVGGLEWMLRDHNKS